MKRDATRENVKNRNKKEEHGKSTAERTQGREANAKTEMKLRSTYVWKSLAMSLRR
jgi:hypothetical protein